MASYSRRISVASWGAALLTLAACSSAKSVETSADAVDDADAAAADTAADVATDMAANPTADAAADGVADAQDVAAADVPEIFTTIVSNLANLSVPIRQLLMQRLRAEGGITWAPIGHGLALPHPSARVSLGRDSGMIALVLLRDHLILSEPTPDGLPIQHFLFFLSPSPRGHLELLSKLGRALSTTPLRDAITRHADDESIWQAIGDWELSQLIHTKPGGAA